MSLLNNRFLFVHINKSGGGIITKTMKENGNVKLTGYHRSLNDMLKLCNNLDQKSLYIFTMVRNPFDRMLSLYLFYHKNNFNRPEFFSGNDEIDNDFNNWIEYIYSDNFDRNRIHSNVNIFKYCFSNQLNWLKDDNNCLIRIDKIFKYEDNSYDELFGKIMELNKYNSNEIIHPTKHKHYSHYYNKKSIELVSKYYQEDLDYFNYNFTYLNSKS
tara:strand:- start:1481 stop:2122 length:642 start_codon:yes stop_codon:yes gene_type:complete